MFLLFALNTVSRPQTWRLVGTFDTAQAARAYSDEYGLDVTSPYSETRIVEAHKVRLAD
jgi:hypothetical protein